MTFSSVKKAVNHEVGWILLFVRTGAIVYLCKFKVLPVLNLVKSELLNVVPTEKCLIFIGFRFFISLFILVASLFILFEPHWKKLNPPQVIMWTKITIPTT